MDKDKQFFDTGKHKKFDDEWYYQIVNDLMDLATLAKYNQQAKTRLFGIKTIAKIEYKYLIKEMNENAQ